MTNPERIAKIQELLTHAKKHCRDFHTYDPIIAEALSLLDGIETEGAIDLKRIIDDAYKRGWYDARTEGARKDAERSQGDHKEWIGKKSIGGAKLLGEEPPQ